MNTVQNLEENVVIRRPGVSQPVIIADLDGTIADDTERAQNLAQVTEEHGREHITDIDWKSYFKRCDEDKPIHDTILLLKALKEEGWYVMILTSRCSSVRARTVYWLQDVGVPYDALVMRDHTDIGRGGSEFKKQVVRGLPQHTREGIKLVLEDRKKLVDMWRAEGYTCHQVNEGTH